MVIDLHQLSKTYPNQVKALKEVNFSATGQEFIGLAGANGSGKSTFLKLIAGQLEPEQGRTEVFGRNAFKHANQLTREIAYISQDWALDPEMNGHALLAYFAALYGLSGTNARQRLEQLIEGFAMQEFIARRISTYSGGQMQRLHLAIGLVHQPKLLLLDEPTNALDPSARVLLWQLLKTYQQQGNTILLASHDLDSIQQYCSRVVLFAQGRIVADATPTELVLAHAQPTLHIKTAEPLTKLRILEQNLRDLAAELDIQTTADTVSLVFKEVDKADMLLKTLQVFANLQQTVAECRWEEAGLAAAYFKLTGAALTKPQAGQTKNHKPGSRRQQ
jgi:ABC-2 type transport system ATP-binding protein